MCNQEDAEMWQPSHFLTDFYEMCDKRLGARNEAWDGRHRQHHVYCTNTKTH